MLAVGEHESNEPFTRSFAAVARGWAEGRVVQLTYDPGTGIEKQTRVHPYMLEPDAALRSVYLIGHDEPADAMRTYKVERIRSATLTTDRYVDPDDFDPDAWLANSWGIWSSDSTPTERVRLRFDAAVSHRVREAIWHRSQELVELPGGSVELTVTVAGTVEIRPWILSWGKGSRCSSRRRCARPLPGPYGTLPRAMPTEVEAKFRAETADPLVELAARPRLGRAVLGTPRTVDEVDRYLDTADGRLADRALGMPPPVAGGHHPDLAQGPADRADRGLEPP